MQAGRKPMKNNGSPFIQIINWEWKERFYITELFRVKEEYLDSPVIIMMQDIFNTYVWNIIPSDQSDILYFYNRSSMYLY